ncbi:MAG: PAS domain S-box protein [Nitrospira sp.]|nr:PAS domain S-box protein [Nitrospira sp.]MDH5624890.1 PAS domain S-box protein [Nitrospira sp.]
MKVGYSLVMRAAPWAIPVLTIGIFIFDLLTPAGVGIPMLYVLPLVLTIFTPPTRDSVHICLLVTGLIWIELLFNPPGPLAAYAVLNRALGTFVMWSVTLGLFRYKQVEQGLSQAETEKAQSQRDLMSERVERAHAEGLMMVAQEARAYADTAAMGAAASRRDAEEKLQISRLRLDGIIESAMDAIITVDEGQQVVLFNRAAVQMFGCSAQEAIGQPIVRFLPTRFRAAHRRHIQSFGQAGVTSRKMGRLGTVSGLRADGEEFPVEAAISHIAVEGKKYYTVILRDITEHRRVTEELRSQHEFIEAVLETVGALVVVLDRHGKILRFNRACEQATGYSSEEITGKAVWDVLLVPEEIDEVKAMFARLTDGEPRNEHENVWVAKDGRRRRIAWSNTVITNRQGAVDYLVGTGIDVTLLNQIQEQLRKTERIAELGTLASGMAHEIGTPMNVILGRAEYLMDRVKEEPVRKGLQTIVAQVERITKVMNQLLAFARRKSPERGPLALKDIVDDSLELFWERLAKARVTVELALDDHCPAAQADADQMRQVIINLIMNALHAMEGGGTLRVGLEPEQDRVKLTVADTGHGIPKDALQKIFEPFFTTKEFGKGTGLGLTVVKGIIEEHQGTITVDSEEGKGTTFTVWLPRSR